MNNAPEFVLGSVLDEIDEWIDETLESWYRLDWLERGIEIVDGGR